MLQNILHQVIRCDSNPRNPDPATIRNVTLEIITDEDGVQLSIVDSDHATLIVTIEPINDRHDGYDGRLYLRLWSLEQLAARGEPYHTLRLEGD